MSPKTDKPRLNSLVPDEVGEVVHARAFEHTTHLAFLLGAEEPREHSRSQVKEAAATLCHYAQTGEKPPGDLDDHYLPLIEALYTTAGSPSDIDMPEIDSEADPHTVWGLVLVAAGARQRITAKESISARQLAALGSCSSDHVRLLARQRKIRRRKDGHYAAKEVKRWLSGRGVTV